VSDEVDASKVTVSLTLGTVGEWVNRATGPGAATVAEIVAVWVKVPLVPVTVTVKEPPVEPLNVHVEV
jgi:hypothetical protein